MRHLHELADREWVGRGLSVVVDLANCRPLCSAARAIAAGTMAVAGPSHPDRGAEEQNYQGRPSVGQSVGLVTNLNNNSFPVSSLRKLPEKRG